MRTTRVNECTSNVSSDIFSLALYFTWNRVYFRTQECERTSFVFILIIHPLWLPRLQLRGDNKPLEQIHRAIFARFARHSIRSRRKFTYRTSSSQRQTTRRWQTTLPDAVRVFEDRRVVRSKLPSARFEKRRETDQLAASADRSLLTIIRSW